MLGDTLWKVQLAWLFVSFPLHGYLSVCQFYLIQGSLQKSSERLKKAEVKSSNERKKRRKMLKFKNITKIQRTIANEGPPYKAVDFA